MVGISSPVSLINTTYSALLFSVFRAHSQMEHAGPDAHMLSRVSLTASFRATTNALRPTPINKTGRVSTTFPVGITDLRLERAKYSPTLVCGSYATLAHRSRESIFIKSPGQNGFTKAECNYSETRDTFWRLFCSDDTVRGRHCIKLNYPITFAIGRIFCGAHAL